MGYPLRSIILAALLAFSGGVGQAGELAIQCDFPRQELGEWISPTIFLGHKPGAKKAVVVDPLILAIYKKPIEAHVVIDTSERLEVKWSLKPIEAKDGTTVQKFRYRAVYHKKRKVMNAYAVPQGFDNQFHSRGKCRPSSRSHQH